ncbi:MAG: hypothetical protein ACYDHP_05835 [Ferrimicrobium sp.]
MQLNWHVKIGVRYTSAWYVLGRIRCAVSQREEHYLLNGEVDVDDMFIGGVSPGRPGRSTHKVPCLIAVSLDEHSHPKYMRVTPVDRWDQFEVCQKVVEMVDVNAGAQDRQHGWFQLHVRHWLHPYPEPSRHTGATTSTSPRFCTPTIANLKAQMQGGEASSAIQALHRIISR